MRDHNHRMWIFADIAFQPRRAFKIEIVCRLIQQQQIRFRNKHPRNRRAHPPTARELFGRAVKVFGLKPKPREHHRRARIRVPCINIHKPLMNFANAVRVCRGLRFYHQGVTFLIGGQNHIHDGFIRRVYLLRNPAHARAFIQAHRGIFGLISDFFADEPQQC